MIPPSNSFVHAQHKLAEVLAAQNRVTSAAPPPYAQTAPEVSSGSNASAELCLEDESPVTINIDASINVVGNGNTIIIPTAGQASSSQPTATGPMPSPTATSTPEGSVPSTPGADATTILQSAQKPRQAKLTEMAVSIISALQDSGRLEQREPGGAEPIEININTAWKIKGDRNVICAGARPGVSIKRNSSNHAVSEKEEEGGGGGRKRRAQSVCILVLGVCRVWSWLTTGPGALGAADGEEGSLIVTCFGGID